MATKKFDIDEVIAGAKIVQRSGESAKFIAYVQEAGEDEQLVWFDPSNGIQLSFADGSYYIDGNSNHDLLIEIPDPPAPKKIVQAHTGTRTEQGKVYDMWYDTLWDEVKYAREQFPNEIYREVLVTA
jgi:hypothetical protein